MSSPALSMSVSRRNAAWSGRAASAAPVAPTSSTTSKRRTASLAATMRSCSPPAAEPHFADSFATRPWNAAYRSCIPTARSIVSPSGAPCITTTGSGPRNAAQLRFPIRAKSPISSFG